MVANSSPPASAMLALRADSADARSRQTEHLSQRQRPEPAEYGQFGQR
jgi:hypothetical protein